MVDSEKDSFACKPEIPEFLDSEDFVDHLYNLRSKILLQVYLLPAVVECVGFFPATFKRRFMRRISQTIMKYLYHDIIIAFIAFINSVYLH